MRDRIMIRKQQKKRQMAATDITPSGTEKTLDVGYKAGLVRSEAPIRGLEVVNLHEWH